jgi:hypothetical protein
MADQIVQPGSDLAKGAVLDRLDQLRKDVAASLDDARQAIEGAGRLAGVTTLEFLEPIDLKLLFPPRRAHQR